eukprot:762517-Hanusia_phi.AAC.4
MAWRRDRSRCLDPLGKLVALNVCNSLRQDLQVFAGGKESNFLAANLVHRLRKGHMSEALAPHHLSDTGEAILPRLRALRESVQKPLEHAHSLEHAEHDDGDDSKVDDEPDEMVGSEEDVPEDSNGTERQRCKAGWPGSLDSPPDGSSLVLEDHRSDGVQAHDAQERKRVHVGKGPHTAVEQDEEEGANHKECERDEMIRPPPPVLSQKELRQAAIQCQPPCDARHADKGRDQGTQQHRASVSCNPEAKIFASSVICDLGKHISVMGLDGVEVQNTHAHDGEGRVHQEDDQPGVEQSLEEHALLLLLDVVDRGFIPCHSQQGHTEPKDERERPVVLERLAQVGCDDLRILHHESGCYRDEEAHRRYVHNEDSNGKEGTFSDPQDAQDAHKSKENDSAPVNIQLRHQVGRVRHALSRTHHSRRHVRQERQTCSQSSQRLRRRVEKKTVRSSVERNR